MKLKIIAGCALACAAAAALSGCTTASSTAMSPITQAIAAQIPHCHVTGSFQVGAGGIAGTGTGVSAANTFDCPAQPYEPATPAPTATP